MKKSHIPANVGRLVRYSLYLFVSYFFFFLDARAQIMVSVKERPILGLDSSAPEKNKKKGIRILFFNVLNQRIESLYYIDPNMQKATSKNTIIKLPHGCRLEIQKSTNQVTLLTDKTSGNSLWILCPRKFLSPDLSAQGRIRFVSYRGESLALVKGEEENFLKRKTLFSFLKKYKHRRVEIHRSLEAVIVEHVQEKDGKNTIQEKRFFLNVSPEHAKEINEIGRCVTEITFFLFGMVSVDQGLMVNHHHFNLFEPLPHLQKKENGANRVRSLWIVDPDYFTKLPRHLSDMRKEARASLEKGLFFKNKEKKKSTKKKKTWEDEHKDSVFILRQHILRDGRIESFCEHLYPYGFIEKFSSQFSQYVKDIDIDKTGERKDLQKNYHRSGQENHTRAPNS